MASGSPRRAAALTTSATSAAERGSRMRVTAVRLSAECVSLTQVGLPAFLTGRSVACMAGKLAHPGTGSNTLEEGIEKRYPGCVGAAGKIGAESARHGGDQPNHPGAQ